MSDTTDILKKEPSLTWTDRVRYFEEMKNPLLQKQAAASYVQTFQAQIRSIARQSTWSKQWGFDDAYQHAVTFVLEKAIEATDPDQLPRRLDILDAVKEEAANQIYTVSLSPYLIKKYGYSSSSFQSESPVSDQSNQPQVFDEITWRRIQRLATEHLSEKDQGILALLMEIPGRVPPIEEIAERLSLKLETAKRYVRRLKKNLREVPELLAMYQSSIGRVKQVVKPQPKVVAVPKPVVKPQPKVVAVSKKVVSIAKWRRPKIRQVEHDVSSPRYQAPIHRIAALLNGFDRVYAWKQPRVVQSHQHELENEPLRVLNKPLQVLESSLTLSLEPNRYRDCGEKAWNDWNRDTGDLVA